MQVIFRWIYAQLLKLYPAQFYTEFANEMLVVFNDLLEDRFQQNVLQGMWIALREIVWLIVCIYEEQAQIKNDSQGEKFMTNQRALTRQTLIFIVLPTIVGLAILIFRDVQVFYSSHKIWAILVGMAVMFAGYSWFFAKSNRLILLALPGLGMTLFFGLRLLPALAVDIWIWVPMLVLCGLVGWMSTKIGKHSWRLWTLLFAMPSSALLVSVGVMAAEGVFQQHLSTGQILDSYVKGAFIQGGTMAFLILASLPLGWKQGARAIFFMLGFLFFDMMGLSASFGTDLPQRIFAGLYIVFFFSLFPVLYLHASGKSLARIAVLGPVGLLHVVTTLALQVEGWSTLFVLYRVGEVIQILLGLLLAFEIYDYFNPTSRATSQLATDQMSGLPV
jgi:hypothetical protein